MFINITKGLYVREVLHHKERGSITHGVMPLHCDVMTLCIENQLPHWLCIIVSCDYKLTQTYFHILHREDNIHSKDITSVLFVFTDPTGRLFCFY